MLLNHRWIMTGLWCTPSCGTTRKNTARKHHTVALRRLDKMIRNLTSGSSGNSLAAIHHPATQQTAV
jgi:hypothetical protein